jgi:hypothetical protein
MKEGVFMENSLRRCIERKQAQRSFDSAGRFASDSSGCAQDDNQDDLGNKDQLTPDY